MSSVYVYLNLRDAPSENNKLDDAARGRCPSLRRRLWNRPITPACGLWAPTAILFTTTISAPLWKRFYLKLRRTISFLMVTFTCQDGLVSMSSIWSRLALSVDFFCLDWSSLRPSLHKLHMFNALLKTIDLGLSVMRRIIESMLSQNNANKDCWRRTNQTTKQSPEVDKLLFYAFVSCLLFTTSTDWS